MLCICIQPCRLFDKGNTGSSKFFLMLPLPLFFYYNFLHISYISSPNRFSCFHVQVNFKLLWVTFKNCCIISEDFYSAAVLLLYILHGQKCTRPVSFFRKSALCCLHLMFTSEAFNKVLQRDGEIIFLNINVRRAELLFDLRYVNIHFYKFDFKTYTTLLNNRRTFFFFN